MSRPTGARRRGPALRRRRSGLLLSAAVACLIGSALLRLAGGAGEALADELSTLIPATATRSEELVCPDDAALNTILTTLQQREDKVAAAESRITEREAALAAAQARIDARLAELKAAEERLSATMARTATAAEDDVGRLVSFYEAMKPKDAAALFAAMDPEFAAGFLGRMRPEPAGAILAGLPAERAYAISVILAGRNAKVPVPPATAGAVE